MRAIAVSGFGATPELIDLPKPTPGPGELLVRIHAAGYNPYDLSVVNGVLKDAMPHKFPLILGLDGAGTVEAIGPGVTAFKPEEKVYGQFLNPSAGMGSYTEYAIAAAGGPIARMPDGMIFTQAAAVPTASMTAFNLVKEARIDSGHRVLIVGATGGVGQSAVQFAANAGARVIATAGPDAAALIRALGARETVHPAGFAAAVSGLIGVLSVTGRLVTTAAGRRWKPTTIVAAIFALQAGAAAAITIPAIGRDRYGAALCILGFGLGFGVATIARPALLTDLYGTTAYGTLSGLMAAPLTIAKATAPLAAAALLTLTGSYAPVLLGVAACCALAAVALTVVRI